MNLYLMRHANAGLARENPKLDTKRGLIKEGKEQCMLMARVLSAFKAQIDVMVSSPIKRAMQTAQFVGTELGYECKVQIEPRLRWTGITPTSRGCWASTRDARACWWWATIPTCFSFWAG